MNFKSLVTIALATATIAIALPTFSQSSSSVGGDRVTFSCQNVFDPASGTQIPATVAWRPQRQKNVIFLYWKSDFFSAAGWDPQARCEEVSPKFQAAYDSDRFNYLTNGKVGAYPVICAAVERIGETCNQDNFLFTLKKEADGSKAVDNLMGIFKGDTRKARYESSQEEGKIYVSIDKFLLEAPAIEENASN